MTVVYPRRNSTAVVSSFATSDDDKAPLSIQIKECLSKIITHTLNAAGINISSKYNDGKYFTLFFYLFLFF
jgi:hypothetical protein